VSRWLAQVQDHQAAQQTSFLQHSDLYGRSNSSHLYKSVAPALTHVFQTKHISLVNRINRHLALAIAALTHLAPVPRTLDRHSHTFNLAEDHLDLLEAHHYPESVENHPSCATFADRRSRAIRPCRAKRARESPQPPPQQRLRRRSPERRVATRADIRPTMTTISATALPGGEFFTLTTFCSLPHIAARRVTSSR
jgi:hypothetical protein